VTKDVKLKFSTVGTTHTSNWKRRVRSSVYGARESMAATIHDTRYNKDHAHARRRRGRGRSPHVRRGTPAFAPAPAGALVLLVYTCGACSAAHFVLSAAAAAIASSPFFHRFPCHSSSRPVSPLAPAVVRYSRYVLGRLPVML
jgi:hypothetical protein